MSPFTDEDLLEVRRQMKAGEEKNYPYLAALLARLDAAERVCKYVDDIKAIREWRKAAGK